MSYAPRLTSKLSISSPAAFLRRCRRDEDGEMTIFTLFILILLLVLVGMAVDFMRFESRRTIMQGAVDRAVLAAADLDQQGDPDAVVRDCVEKAKDANCLDGDPIMTNGSNFRSVTANCKLDLNTYFLKFLGVNQLTARATSTAIESVGNVEVSLVLDISGSMGTWVSGAGTTRMGKLKEASTAFVEQLLTNDHKDRISIFLIPYTTNVNAGPELFDAVNLPRKHWFSECVNFRCTDFDTTIWPTTGATIDLADEPNMDKLEQAQHFTYRNWNNGVCPVEIYEQIIPLTQDKSDLLTAIDDFEPPASTAIYQGLKLSAALLDPSINAAYNSLPRHMRGSAFSDRPVAFGSAGSLGGTLQYISL